MSSVSISIALPRKKRSDQPGSQRTAVEVKRLGETPGFKQYYTKGGPGRFATAQKDTRAGSRLPAGSVLIRTVPPRLEDSGDQQPEAQVSLPRDTKAKNPG